MGSGCVTHLFYCLNDEGWLVDLDEVATFSGAPALAVGRAFGKIVLEFIPNAIQGGELLIGEVPRSWTARQGPAALQHDEGRFGVP